jgi:SSS family solute:Na+ symporter
MSIADITIIIIYILAIMLVGLLVDRKKSPGADDYFLAGRSLRWPVIGAALFASNISTVHLVGLAASGFGDGLVWGNFEWMAVFTLILSGLVFAPFYFKNKIATLPEFLERRYNRSARTCLAVLSLFGALFIHIGVSLYAGAVVLEHLFGVNIYLSIISISFITALYTIIGGLKSVVITETIQTIVIIVGALLITIFGILSLPEHGIHSLAALRAAAKPEQLNLIPSASNPSGLTWPAILLGYPVLGIWYWCADQTIVQRVLGARSLRDAQIGPLFAASIKILPVFILVLPGVLGYVLFKDKITQANDTFPVLVTELLPIGLKGLVTAAVLAALMSTVAAALSSAGSLVSIDIVKQNRPSISERKQVLIGRITAVVVMVLAISWSPVIARFKSIFEAINVLLTVLSPPITTVFIWGIFWKRGNHQGAVASFIGGFSIGLFVFLLDFPVFGNTKIITDTLGISFMMQAFALFVFTSCIYVIVSLLTPAPPPSKVVGYTLDSPFKVSNSSNQKKLLTPAWTAAMLVVLMIILYGIMG